MTRSKILFAVMIVLLIGAFPDIGRGAQAKDEVLKIAVSTEISSVDPTLWAAGTDLVVAENWVDFLMHRDTSGKVVPGLAAAWKIAPDGKKMEFTLRKGVKFHSGDLFTTKDVQFSFERGREKNKATKSNLALVEQLEIIDDYHFNVYFKSPDVLFIPRRGGQFPIASKSYYDRVGEETFSKQPSGTGPYKMVSYKPGEYVDIERFEEYWGKKPPIKKARIYFVGEDTTRVAKLRAGEVDLIDIVPVTEVRGFEKSPNFKVIRLPTYHPTMAITFGTNNPKMPWYDKRVRLAMAHAINGKSIIDDVLLGIPVRLAGVAPHELGYDPALKPYPYDPKKAKTLLAEAGYPNGFEINLPWMIAGGVAMSQEVAQAIASYFEAVGIRTKLTGKDQIAMLSDRQKALDPNVEYIAYYTGGVPGGMDPTVSLGTFFTKGGSRACFEKPEITKIINEARTTMDNKKRGELIKKSLQMLHEEVAVIPIQTSISVFALRKNLDFSPTKNYNTAYVHVKDMAFK
jgi:peptide/nickel transport system substrate-binding protein